MKFQTFVNNAFWALLVAIIGYAAMKLDSMAQSVESLARTVAVQVQISQETQDKVNSLTGRMNAYERLIIDKLEKLQ